MSYDKSMDSEFGADSQSYYKLVLKMVDTEVITLSYSGQHAQNPNRARNRHTPQTAGIHFAQTLRYFNKMVP